MLLATCWQVSLPEARYADAGRRPGIHPISSCGRYVQNKRVDPASLGDDHCPHRSKKVVDSFDCGMVHVDVDHSYHGCPLHTFRTLISHANIRYLEFKGEGRPLLMIHGLGCASSFEYPHVAAAPALSGRHIILLDLLGFGFSDRPVDFEYRVADHALQIHRFVEERRTDQIDIYGHSMGGSIAIEVADLLGARVRHLMLSEANLDSGGGEFSRPIAALEETDYINGGHLRTIVDAQAAGDEEWAATMRAASALAVYRGARSLVEGGSPCWRSRFLKHPARKAFIFGEQSLPDPDAEALSSCGIRILVVPNAGHAMGLDNPSGLALAIAEFLRDSRQR